MSRKILIVEDDADTRQGLTIRLKAAGYAVVAAGDGQSAITQAQRERPDLVLLDLGLPAGDGHVVMQRLAALGLQGTCPIVVLTARQGEDETRKALAEGAVAVLHKPVDNALLLSTIAQHVAAERAAEPAAAGEAALPRVLVIEDDAVTQLALKIRLQASGFQVTQASDGATAMTHAVKERPDVILLDLGLPGGGGLAVLERLKRNAQTQAIPVVILSAHDPAANAPEALAAGAMAYIQKPPDNAVLIATLRRAVGL